MPETPPSSTALPAPAPEKQRVLLIDDDHNIRDIIAEAVEILGGVVVHSETLAKAQEAIQKDPNFAVLLCDQRMPDGSGLDFCRRLKSEHPQIVRVLITGFPDMRVAVAAINDGEIFRFVAKPFTVDDLRIALHDAFERSRLTRENQRLQTALVTANEQLQKVNLSLEKALSNSFTLCLDILDRFDHMLASHSFRVARWAVAIGRQFSLSKEQLDTLEIAARMHDIGLISSSRAVHGIQQIGWDTLPPLPQTALHGHPKAGAELMRFLQHTEVADIILAHQEWFNGGGYPFGLAGERIPFSAAIIAVPDAYDEVPMARPDAAKFIEDNLGIRFHPEVGRAFLRLLSEHPDYSKQEREVLIGELQPDMKLTCNLFSASGVLLVPKGQSLTPRLIEYVHRHNQTEPLIQRIYIES
jgi:response regulator RpfG family c-di-GMP phosphodiesterase